MEWVKQIPSSEHFRMKTRRVLPKKRSVIYSLFVFAILLFLFNEWVLIFRSVSLLSSSKNQWQLSLPSLFWFHAEQHQQPEVLPDGLIYYAVGPPQSLVHCVGENFLRNAWVLKSCQFEHVCIEGDGQFTLYPSTQQRRRRSNQDNNITQLSDYARSSTDPFTQHVSLSATQPTWIAEQRHRWFPTVLETNNDSGSRLDYYELPSSTVLVPLSFDPALLQRQSYILFDILLPIYTLLTLFGWQDRQILLLPVDDLSSPSPSSSPSLCFNKTLESCYPAEFLPFIPLLNLAPFPTHLPASARLCARRAAAGLGALSDHGNKKHGERPVDYQTSHNVGKGPALWNFRKYVLRHAGFVDETPRDEAVDMDRRRLVFASSHVQIPEFWTAYESYLQENSNVLPDLELQLVNLTQLSLYEKMSLALKTTFWVSRVGEDSIPAFFLPRGGTVIVFYNDKVQTAGKKSNRPAMLHWDLLNHASHLTVHWLPEPDITNSEALESRQLFLQIIRLQLDFLQKETNPDNATRNVVGVQDLFALGEKLTWVDQGQEISSSSAHCLGDNFVSYQAPCYRSCHYRHFCLDVGQKEFQLALSHEQQDLQHNLDSWTDGFRVVATNLNQTIMDGRNVRFVQNLPWAPSVVNSTTNGFYSLPDDVLWVPYTLDASFAGNPGHLFWDFLLPFYSLLTMYGQEGKKRLLLTSLDDECRTTPKCGGLVQKFFPVMGAKEIYSTEHLQIQGGETDQTFGVKDITRICARHAAAGIGMLTEHGSTRHGQTLDDYQRVQNSGRGAHFCNFRNFMIRNLGIDEASVNNRPRHGVLFSVNSSTSLHRKKAFTKQIAAARDDLGKDAYVSGVEFARFPIRDQIQAILQTSVLISTVGGSTATAMFLPRHSSLILYFSSEEDFVGRSRKKDFPTMMDFDFWNNAAYIRVHWVPTGSMDEDFHLRFLVDLIRSELIQTERFRLE